MPSKARTRSAHRTIEAADNVEGCARDLCERPEPAVLSKLRLIVDYRDNLLELIRNRVDLIDEHAASTRAQEELRSLVPALEQVDRLFGEAKRKGRPVALTRLFTHVRAARLAALHEQLAIVLGRGIPVPSAVRVLNLRIDRHGELYERDVYPQERVEAALRDQQLAETLARKGAAAAAWLILARLEGLADESSARKAPQQGSALGRLLYFVDADRTDGSQARD